MRKVRICFGDEISDVRREFAVNFPRGDACGLARRGWTIAIRTEDRICRTGTSPPEHREIRNSSIARMHMTTSNTLLIISNVQYDAFNGIITSYGELCRESTIARVPIRRTAGTASTSDLFNLRAAHQPLFRLRPLGYLNHDIRPPRIRTDQGNPLRSGIALYLIIIDLLIANSRCTRCNDYYHCVTIRFISVSRFRFEGFRGLTVSYQFQLLFQFTCFVNAFRSFDTSIDIAICYCIFTSQYRCNRCMVEMRLSRAQQPACSPRNELSRNSAGNSVCGPGRNSLDDVRHPAVEQGLIDAILRESNKTADIPVRHAAVSPLSVDLASGMHASYWTMQIPSDLAALTARELCTATSWSNFSQHAIKAPAAEAPRSLLTARATQGGNDVLFVNHSYRWRYGSHRRLCMSRKTSSSLSWTYHELDSSMSTIMSREMAK